MSASGSRAASTAATVWSATILLLSLAAVLGVLDGTLLNAPAAALAAIMACGFIAALAGRHRRRVWLPALLLAALALGLWRYEATRPPSGPAGLPYYAGREVTLVGTVAAEPEPLDRGENLRLQTATLTTGGVTHRVGGLVLVHLPVLTAYAYGDRLSIAGLLERPPDLPGSSTGSYRAYLASQGVYAVMNYPRVQRLATGGGNPLLVLVVALRQLLEGGIRRVLPGPEAALLTGILLGTRTRALGALTALFVATGMIHVVAISGLKVSVVTGTVERMARRLWGPRRALFPALGVLTLYVLLTGMTPAGLRAALMWALALLAVRFGRRSDLVTSLALAAAVLALVSPRILWDVGFQLSVGGTAAIGLLEPRIERRLARFPPVVRETLAVTLAAQIGTLPLQVSGFGQLSLVAPLANALLLPLLGPIIALGAPLAGAGALLPPVGTLLGWLVYPFLALMEAVVRLLAGLPLASVPLGAWPLLPVAAYYALVALTAWWPRAGVDALGLPHVPVRPLWAGLGAVALLLATVGWQAPRPVYTLSVLDVGAGQALLLTTPAGRAVLVDGGDTPARLDAALGDRLPFWRSRLDAVVSSDLDVAHVGGLRGLTAHYTVGRALDPGAFFPTATYAQWRAELRGAGAAESKLRTGARYHIDRGAYLDVLLPFALNPNESQTPVALRLVVGRFSLLVLNRFALDAEPTALVADGARRDTMLVLPAGAAPSSYPALIRLLHPRLVVLPSTDDARDDRATDHGMLRAAHTLGARVWQGGDSASLRVLTDGSRYTLQG